MNIGMLWFDNDPKVSLDIKVERAAAYYRHKYGRSPTLCFVHPRMLPDAGATAKNDGQSKAYTIGGIEVRSNRSVLPNHLWIGVNGSPEVATAQP